MADDIFTDAGLRRVVTDEVASRIGIAAVVVEKDLWVCWTLARLREIRDLPKLTFKGGTSLSKVHGLIHRFSEDLDLTFSRDGWGFDGDRDPLSRDLSNKARARLVKDIVSKAAAIVSGQVIPGLRLMLTDSLGESGWSVELAPEHEDREFQTVIFNYPALNTGSGYLKPAIRMEFGARGDPWPTGMRIVTPYVEQEIQGTAQTAIATVETLDAERTFWEKATLLHELHHLTKADPKKPTARLSRHLYDLHQMWGPLRQQLNDGQQLLLRVTQNKECFFPRSAARYELVRAGTINTTPHSDLEANLRADYLAMKDMFFPGQPVPSFESIMKSMQEIDAVVAGWDWSQTAAL